MGSLTAANIIDDALNRSSMNSAGLVSDTRAMRILDRAQRAIYVRAAIENPDYFGAVGVTSTRTAYTAAWDISQTPSRIAAISRLEVDTITGTVTDVSAGDEVHMVQFLHQSLGLAPRVYVRGQKITDVGTELGAADANMVTIIKVFYSPIPAAFSATTDPISIPDVWADLMVLPLARAMAMKDGQRSAEVKELREEYDEVLGLFAEAVKIFDFGAARSLLAIRPLPAGGRSG